METGKFPHDAAYKAIFSYPEMVKSLLVDFVKEDFTEGFDFRTLAMLPASFVGPEFQQRHDDMIWRVKWRDTECYICLLLEFQSAQDTLMGLRLNTYISLLWLTLLKNGLIKPGSKLPPVFLIVLYNGDSPWKAPLNLRELIEPLHDKLAIYQPDLRYFLVDEKRIPKEILETAKGDAAYIFRAEQTDSGNDIYQLAIEFTEQPDNDSPPSLKRDVLHWMERRIKKVDSAWLKQKSQSNEGEDMLEEMVYEHIKRVNAHKEKILDEGRAEGRAEGYHHALFFMLKERFGEIPENWRKKILGVATPNSFDRLAGAVYTVKSPDDFYKILIDLTENNS